ncbi:hypothetical protein SASPL_139989 [Salvia splendens]|uniref:SAUR family protein n=1 Tax=Salvia splendens TaxID=180675 RepID=A0A8X8WQ24_SALSN|nr:hypothetical protein SASPL_139989 [Salvia splendens]
MQEDKKMKVKKGCLAVQVGLEDEDGGFKRFSIPISYLYHPLFQKLLDKAREWKINAKASDCLEQSC